MSGKIVQSTEVTAYIMQNRDFFRKGALDSITSLVASGRNSDTFIRGMEQALELGGFQLERDWTIVVLDKIRVFLGSPDEVLVKLHELPRKKLSTLPQKVVTKMLALRFQKVWYQHREHIAAVDSTNNTSEMRRPIYSLKFPDFKSPQEVTDFLWKEHNALSGNWKLREKTEELQNFLKEHGHLLDDVIVQEAWAMVQVREVMES